MSKPTLTDLLATPKSAPTPITPEARTARAEAQANQKAILDRLFGKTPPKTETAVPPLPPVSKVGSAPTKQEVDDLSALLTAREPVKKKSRKRRAYELKDKCPKTLTGEQIKRWRLALGITQDKARKLLGMSRTSYIEMEHDGVRSKRTVLALRAVMRGLHKSPLYKHEGTVKESLTVDDGA